MLAARTEKESKNLQEAKSPGDDEAQLEDDLLLPQEAETDHPFRLIEFPRNFRERLNEFPHHVRSAMAILGGWPAETPPPSTDPDV